MLKKLELSSPTSCLNRAAPDEVVFVLRAKDPVAPQTLRHWATMAEGVHEADKVAEARACADAMDAWRVARFDPQGKPWPQVTPEVPTPPAPAPRIGYR
jgi:hypothetical protein